LENVQRVLNKRYGSSRGVEEFSRKAQLAHYEDVRAQYESYATHWQNRKMLVHWMMNNPWPSMFGHLFDYYFKQGGGYFGAKKGLQPLTVVWDYYATGDRKAAKIYAVNLTQEPREHLRVSAEIYDLNGVRRSSKEVPEVKIAAGTSVEAMTMARDSSLDSVFFVRLRLKDATNSVLAENVYWASNADDVVGNPNDPAQFKTELEQWADLSALNTLPAVNVKLACATAESNGTETATMTLTNQSNHIAFFLRAEMTAGPDGEEILPITYDDNYVTLFPEQTKTIVARYERPATGPAVAVRLQGYNVAKIVLPLRAKK
jgi:exo-1,4-beta-D-glucosaminidase